MHVCGMRTSQSNEEKTCLPGEVVIILLERNIAYEGIEHLPREKYEVNV